MSAGAALGQAQQDLRYYTGVLQNYEQSLVVPPPPSAQTAKALAIVAVALIGLYFIVR